MSSTESFIRSGLEHYADARAAVERFETDVRELLVSAIRDHDWVGFQTADTKPNDSRAYRWLGAMAFANLGAVPEQGRLELGIWWNPEHLEPHRCVLAAGFFEGPAWIRKGLEPPASNGRVKVHSRSGTKYLYLILENPAEVDLEKECEALLDALDECVQRSRPQDH